MNVEIRKSGILEVESFSDFDSFASDGALPLWQFRSLTFIIPYFFLIS